MVQLRPIMCMKFACLTTAMSAVSETGSGRKLRGGGRSPTRRSLAQPARQPEAGQASRVSREEFFAVRSRAFHCGLSAPGLLPSLEA